MLTYEALRGLEGTIIGSKRCRRHYGTVVARPFRPGLDPVDGYVFSDPISGQCRGGWMTWQIKKVSCSGHESISMGGGPRLTHPAGRKDIPEN